MQTSCPICKKPLKVWYSGCGGKKFTGCSDINCDYKKEIE